MLRRLKERWLAVIVPSPDSDGGNPHTSGGGERCRYLASSRMVLVIDDDPAVRGSLKFSLEIEGFSVRCYESPAEFLAARDLPRRACLIVDQKMPGISGLDLLASLNADRRAAMPAILITSYPSEALRGRADAAGIRIVEKPLLGNALSEAICQVMART